MSRSRPRPSRPRAASRPLPAEPAPTPALATGVPSLGHPLVLVTALACLMATVTFKLNDPDFWQHLTVGRAIWQLKSVPATNLWSWPTHGQPDVLPSWGFRALLYPFWAAG